MNQHSVFQLNKNQYYLFDNHSFASARPESQWQEASWETKLIVCRYLNGGVDKEQIVVPRIRKLKVPTEGRIYNMSDKLWFFEDSSAGIFMLFEDNEVRYVSKNLDQNGQTLPFSWCRPFLKTTLP
jgi:hypothetical protein